jgi:hypothetical protein
MATIEAAVVQVTDGEFVTDALGIATIELTTDQMLALVAAGVEDCSTRLLPITVNAQVGDQGYFSYCPTVEVACGDTGTTPHDVKLVPIPPLTIEWTCCADLGCETGGPAGRGRMYKRLFVTYTASAFDGTTTWTYQWEGELDLLVDGVTGEPLLGQVVYESACQAGDFVTPPVPGCFSGSATRPYISARLDLTLCQGGPGGLHFEAHQNTACSGSGGDTGTFPACFRSLDYAVDLPAESVASMCVGESILESWQTTHGGARTIDHTLAVTGITEEP